jgi:HTH-type transcriptional regulator / antitoxin MqsA
MTEDIWQEEFHPELVTYTLELNGKLIMIENVPARVSERTGEQLFAPDVVGRIQEIVWSQEKPKRMIQTPVYEYAA